MTTSSSPSHGPGAVEPPAASSYRDASSAPQWLQGVFASIIKARWLFLVLYAVLLPPSIYFAVQVNSDNSIDRLIAADDPERVANREFEKVFGAGEYAVLIVEADDPYAPAVLERLDRIEQGLRELSRVQVNSALSIYRRAKAGFRITPETAAAFKKFATGTDLLRQQGLVGDNFLAIAVVLEVHETGERLDAVDGVSRVVEQAGGASPPVRAVRQVGLPYVNVHLHEATTHGGPRYFTLFGVLVVLLTLGLYRSFRALLSFLITLATCVGLTMGYIGMVGGVLTIVSPMLPMMVLVTATACLVYLLSLFVACAAGRAVVVLGVL